MILVVHVVEHEDIKACIICIKELFHVKVLFAEAIDRYVAL